MSVPKKLHLYWGQGFNSPSLPLYVGPNLEKWRTLNPEWSVHRWDAATVVPAMEKAWPFTKGIAAQLSPIKLADLCRVFIISQHGGVYVDADIVPHRPLDFFFADRILRWPLHNKARKLANPPTRPVDFSSARLILSREYRALDSQGAPVANGVLISEAGHPLWKAFAEARCKYPGAPTLQFMGPYALTYFLRANPQLWKDGATLVPPYYFIYEPKSFEAMGDTRPPWVVSSHVSGAEWGDRTKKHWYLSE